MSLTYDLAISKNSIWRIHTPNLQTKQLPFYTNEIGRFECESNFYTRRNKQRDYEIIYTTDGLGEIVYNNITYSLEKNQVFLYDCYNLHHYRTLDKSWNFNWLHFYGDSAQLYYNYITRNSNLINLHNNDSFSFLFNILLELPTEQNLANSLNASQHISNILTELYFSSIETIQVFDKYANEIQIVLDYIKNNYMNHIKLDELCNLIHISKYYFINIFKNHTGSTPHEYIINFRIGKAKKLLRTTNLSIKDICLNVGFNDESYFIKTFKKLNNITPNKYRLIL